MRILFVNPYYKPYLGGIERIIERLSAELGKQAAVEAIGVLTTRAFFPDRWMPELPAHELIDGVEVFRLSFKPAVIRPFFHARLAGYFSLDVPRVLRRFRPDVIHFTYSEWWGANLTTYLASRRTVHVLSTFFHDLPRTRETWPLFATNRRLVPRMDAVHVLTAVERRQVRRAYRAPAARTIVIPPGVDVPARLPDRQGREGVTILAVGRLNEHKGQLALVQMVHRLLARRAAPAVRLWLAGDDAGAGPAIAQFIADHGLGHVVRVWGHCSDDQLADLYRQADIFALPSQYESFGLVFVEAMAQGLPVVTYDAGPVPSVLTQGALLVPLGDTHAFAEALYRLVCDPVQRAELGQAGHQLTARLYGWPVIAGRFLDLYGRLLQRAARSPRRQQP